MPRSLVPLILAGGAGTRLWPLSRETAPKPFIPLRDGESLLAKTVLRALKLPDVSTLVTVTNRDYYLRTMDEYAGLGSVAPRDPVFLLEPFGRNTAPAIALGALWAQANGHEDCVLLVLPADHVIGNLDAFEAAVACAAEWARQGRLVAFGVVPTRPDPAFGYIQCDPAPLDASGNSPPAYLARSFVEKPPLAKVQDFLATGDYLWNSGIFAFTPRAISAALSRHAPQVMATANSVFAGQHATAAATIVDIDAALFAAMPDISIDYAVMEPAAACGDVVVVRGAFAWSDIGSWQAIAALTEADADGNRGLGERIMIDTHGTYVHSQDRIVATVGVENLVIVDTADAVLIAHCDHLQRVKDVVGELKARAHDAYRVHRTATRPWGTYTVLEEAPGFKIKRIEVRPGASLSLQLHHRRSEHWVVVKGVARVTREDAVYDVRANESTFIPRETRHRLENSGAEPLVIIEVQCGEYLGEDDIVRFDAG